MKFIFLTIFISLLSTYVGADSIYLSNNSVVKGEIISINENIVRIETKNGILEVDKGKIVRGEFFGQGNQLSGDLVFEFLLDGKIKDSSGNGYAIKTKSIPYTDGVLKDRSGALKSKGEGEYFYIENSKMLNDLKSFTLAMNFYPVDTAENRFLVSNWGNTYSNGKAKGRFSLSVLKNSLMFYVVDSKGYYQSVGATDVLKSRKWNSVAIKYDSGEISLYVNGDTVSKNKLNSGSLMKGEWPLYFLTAKHGDDFKKYNIIGNVDNIKMFDSKLTDDELNLLYKL